jgi:predicted CXXCH cytochrome family protein
LILATSAYAGVATTKHNLSASGPGSVKASTETQICVFCHAPHNSSPAAPLWNRQNPGGSYTPYTSSTTKAAVGQPTRGSLLCLSCHDGTIALGQVLNRASPIAMAGGVSTLPAGSASRLGTDLSGDHPISFAYTSALAASRGELVDPATLKGPVKVDSSGQMQCGACHDAHNDTYGKFLVMSNTASALCQACHVKNYWTASSHKLSTKAWNGVGPDPFPHTSGTTVADNACESCHRPHNAPGKKWLQNAATEEGNCYTCHNGNVAAKNIQTEFAKSSIHPVASTTGVHDPAESGVVNSRHVECVDCHNPHASNTGNGTLPGSLIGVRGISINGVEINPAVAEYQICFRCHADSLNKPAQKTARVSNQNNTRLDFQPTNKSCHPVAGACSVVSPAPVLVSPWTSTSTMKCDSCHNNNAGPGNNGTGPAGPHGSTNPSLLERSYTGTKPALCAKCHTTTYTKFNGSSGHQKHTGDIGATCNTCHDPHGSANYPSLINFDTSLVTFRSFTPSTAGQANNGSCNLTCHGKNHGSSCTYNNC